MRSGAASPDLGGRVGQRAADERRLERARRERDRRIAERGARILAALRGRAPATDRLGDRPVEPRFDR
jgi:hypothetical protein